MRGLAAKSWMAAAVGSVFASVLCVVALPATATPFYTLDAASRCNSCHVEPMGWSNPEATRDRRCTLDCSGCHVSPTGGGLRTPLGRFYGEQVLPTWGPRPGDGVDLRRLLSAGAPEEGRYSLLEGFEGWWPGEHEFREVEERYGRIDPSPVWQAGGDFRFMVVAPTDGDDARDVVAFPMEAQAYLAAHPLPNLTAYLDVGMQGSQDRSARDFDDVLWLRELFVLVHDMPYGAWARAGRFALPYGWRLPDHTAFTRRGTFDQYRQGYGVEAGVAANEAWGNLALWAQGLDAWPGDNQPPGAGVSAQAGVRRLGYTLGASAHAMAGRDGTANEYMMGPMWGLNLRPMSYLGELSWRRTNDDGFVVDGLAVLHEARFSHFVRGLVPKVRWEWNDPDVLVRDDQRQRVLLGVEWNPYRYVQFDVSYRHLLVPDGRDANELLLQLHTWVL
jgi:hypothetical protein